MKVSTTTSGDVTFSAMKAEMADALVDIVRDLASGNAVLVYGPEYDFPVVKPTQALRDEFERLLRADALYPGALVDPDKVKDSDRWSGHYFSLPGDHKKVWDCIEEAQVEGAK